MINREQYLMSVMTTERKIKEIEGRQGPPGPQGPPGEGGKPNVGDILLTAATYPEPEECWVLCEEGEVLQAYGELYSLIQTLPTLLPSVDTRFQYYVYGGAPDYPPYMFSVRDGNLFVFHQGGETQSFSLDENGNLIYSYDDETEPPAFYIDGDNLFVSIGGDSSA